MSQEIHTINDPAQFEHILNSYYKGTSVQIRVTGGVLPANFLGYSDGNAAFQVQNIKNLPAECTFMVKKGLHLIYGYFKQVRQDEGNLFVFLPQRFQIIAIQRSEERAGLPSEGGGKKLVFITNIVSDFMLVNSLEDAEKTVDRIKEKIVDDFDNAYEHIKVFLTSDGITDMRMKYFHTHKKPIYVPDLDNPDKAPDVEQVNNFINNIHPTDYYFKNSNFKSEISIPLLYMMKMPYGYIQINSKVPMPETVLRNMKQLATMASGYFEKLKIFKSTDERFIVVNISKKGFAIAFKERKFIRYFKKGSAIAVDMILPGDNKASVFSVVRHITTKENKVIIVGFEILDIDAIGEVHYDEFIETIHK